jgi:hypothetical protein
MKKNVVGLYFPFYVPDYLRSRIYRSKIKAVSIVCELIILSILNLNELHIL